MFESIFQRISEKQPNMSCVFAKACVRGKKTESIFRNYNNIFRKIYAITFLSKQHPQTRRIK